MHIDLFGVAMAQTLPEGSAMGFSLEYQIISGGPQPSADYEWVIEPPDGRPWTTRISLQNGGNLNTFVTEWPPNPGTYTTYIRQLLPGGEPTVVSEKLKLPYNYP
jgi:hypothetical protein